MSFKNYNLIAYSVKSSILFYILSHLKLTLSDKLLNLWVKILPVLKSKRQILNSLKISIFLKQMYKKHLSIYFR